MKQFIIILAIIVLIGVAVAIEQTVISNTFEELQFRSEEIKKIVEKGGGEQELVELKDWWNKKKETLHAIIPHNDIKDLDDKFSLAESFLKRGYVTHALAQINAISDLSIAIPKTYEFSIENIL